MSDKLNLQFREVFQEGEKLIQSVVASSQVMDMGEIDQICSNPACDSMMHTQINDLYPLPTPSPLLHPRVTMHPCDLYTSMIISNHH